MCPLQLDCPPVAAVVTVPLRTNAGSISAVTNPCRYGSGHDILLFFSLWRLQALCGGNATWREGKRREWFRKGESTLDSLPFLREPLQGRIKWKEKQVHKCLVKSLVTRGQIMLFALYKEGKLALQCSVIWFLSCPMVKIRNLFYSKCSKHPWD